MQIHLDPASAVPIYEQIRSGLADAILRGDLAPAEALPSIRALARDLRVSVITTTRAYNELVADGLAVSVRGKGVFVRAQRPDALREHAEARIADAFDQARRAAELGGLSRDDLHRLLDDAWQRSIPPEGGPTKEER